MTPITFILTFVWLRPFRIILTNGVILRRYSRKNSEKIKKAMMQAEADHGYNLKIVKDRYCIVDQFYEIDFRKTSKNPIQKSKFFNLAEMLKCKKLPETSQIAKELDGRTWEEFL